MSNRFARGRWNRLIALSLISGATAAWTAPPVLADWNRFRGPNGTGIADDQQATPTTWSPSENIKWKISLPGAGVSCPIVVGDKVFVTSYSGYGMSRGGGGTPSDVTRHLTCIDRTSGKTVWEKSVPTSVPEDEYSGAGVPQHGYASHTPVSDGKNVYVFFGKSGALAFDMEGNQLWQTSVGTGSDDRRWGSSSSPIVYEDVLIVPAGPESRAIVGLNKYTGKELWRADADSLGSVWGTPALVKTGETTELVIGAPSEIWGLNPTNGKLRWFCTYVQSDQFSSSVVVDGETIYAVEGRGGGSVAVKAGGKDDVSESQVVWKGRDSSSFASPIIYDGRMYYVSRRTITCVDAKTHDKIFEGRMTASGGEQSAPVARPEGQRGPDAGGQGGQGFGGPGFGGRGGGGGGGMGGDYSSPIIADGKIYYVARSGETYVLNAGTAFKQLAVNRVTTDDEDFSATPAISHGEIFMRSNKHLYCVSDEK